MNRVSYTLVHQLDQSSRSLSFVTSEYFADVGGRLGDDSEFARDFGHSVTISDDGKTIAVSGMISTDEATRTHMARVKIYYETDLNWNDIGTIDSDQYAQLLEDTRAHVSLSGDASRIAVSILYRASLESPFQGYVNIYEHHPEISFDNWSYFSTEYMGNGGEGGEFHGITASLDYTGSRVAIGIQYDDGVIPEEKDRGLVMACKVGQEECFYFFGMAANARAGSGVMISRNSPYCVVYGSAGIDTVTIMCDENNDDIWTPRGVVLNGEESGDSFGFSVAITSDSAYVAVGATKNDPDATKRDAGHVRVYEWNGSDYIQLGQDIDGTRGREDLVNYYVGDKSGYSIGLSDRRPDNIIRVAIGAPNNPGEDYYYEGHTRLFQYYFGAALPAWNQVLSEVDGETSRESAGRSVGLDKNGLRIIYGSPQFNAILNGYYVGSARVYELRETSSQPSDMPSVVPSEVPSVTQSPSESPSENPSVSVSPSELPSETPSISVSPSESPSETPTVSANPSSAPSETPTVSANPSSAPSDIPSTSVSPSETPSETPSVSTSPTSVPSDVPSTTNEPSSSPSETPSNSRQPSEAPSDTPSTSQMPSESPSNVPSLSITPSESPSENPSISISPSENPSEIPSTSVSPSESPSETPSTSVSPSENPSDVPSVTVSPSESPSETPSISVSPSESPSDVPSVSVSPSESPSETPSISVSPSESPSDVPSVSVSPSESPSETPSISVSPSEGPTIGPSVSVSPSESPSETPSISVSPSESPSDVPSVSVSPSESPSETPSISVSPSESPSDVPSVSVSPSESPSETPSISVSPSESPSDVPSVSVSPSESPSETPSISVSPSESPSDVPSVSVSPSESPSETPSISVSPTESPSDVPTESITKSQTTS